VKLREALKKLFRSSVQAGDGQRPVDNVDALARAGSQRMDPLGGVPGSAPPGWVPPVDEGRPRH
jgi:hypothetical protein